MTKIKDLDYELLANTVGVDLKDPHHRYNQELEDGGFTRVDLPDGFKDIDLAMRIMKFWEAASPGITVRRRGDEIYVWEKTALEDAHWKSQVERISSI